MASRFTKSGEELDRFAKALLDAFPKRSSLERLVKFGLGANLAEFTSNQGLEHDVFELLDWASERSRLDELLRSARQRNPTNELLIAFEKSLAHDTPPRPPTPDTPPPGTPPRDPLLFVIAVGLGFAAGRAVVVRSVDWLVKLLVVVVAGTFAVRAWRKQQQDTVAAEAASASMGLLSSLREGASALALATVVAALTGVCTVRYGVSSTDGGAVDARVEASVDVPVGEDARPEADVVVAREDAQAEDRAHDAAPPPTTVRGTPGACPSGMTPIPAGTFRMGDENVPTTVSAFCIDTTEVTVAAFRVWLVGHLGEATPTDRSQDPTCNWTAQPADRENHPINCVNWNEATAYCHGMGGRLPRDEQWEYAARGQDSLVYPWGNGWDESRACVSRRGGTCAAGATPGDSSPFGVLDLAGNLQEWTEARYVRGASWVHTGPDYARAADRGVDGALIQVNYRGFRCVRGSR